MTDPDENFHPPPTHPVPVTLRVAVSGLSETDQDPGTDHVWVDEKARQTRGYQKALFLKPGEHVRPESTFTGTPIRIWWDRPAPTILKGRSGQPPYMTSSHIHPSRPRALSIREMARCQSFPDPFRFADALNNGMQRIGNSVPPLLARAIAARVRELLPPKP